MPNEQTPLLRPSSHEGTNDHAQSHTHATGPVTVLSSLYAVWHTNRLFNVALLVFVPLGIASSKLGWSDTAVFALNFCAIIPLAKMLDFSTDQLAMRQGETVGGLLNATFGNAVELILSVFALQENLFEVVKASMIGSILSNLLLVLGLCFLLGGLIPFERNKFQKFDVDRANVSTGLLALTFLGFLVPAAVQFVLDDGDVDKGDEVRRIVTLSRGISFILFITYIAYLVFQLYTNPDGLLVTPKRSRSITRFVTDLEQVTEEPESETESEEPVTLGWIAFLALGLSTLVIAVCAEILVGSIEGLSKEAQISEVFIGIIILPIVGNAAEHVTAVSSALRNKLDLSLQVAIGSAHQIALLVTPVVVLAGAFMNKDMDLDFGLFPTAVLFVSVLVVNALIQDGRTHWLEGWTLIVSYLIIALGFYFVPDSKSFVSAFGSK
ncbi:Sodium/calcium exchanger protein-domain-containing protein [Chytriomyces sp. MP71]|nr:Sodium/calcium exchanger protein-domain-containing protein [Chytriomyces sp. MP71]